MREVYFDNNATTKALPAVRDEMLRALAADYGNPSSAHLAGERAREQLRRSRGLVEELLGASAGETIFTSGGTEANNLALLSAAFRDPPDRCRIVTISTEHSSVLKSIEYLQSLGNDICIVPVNGDGLVDLTCLDVAIDSKTTLVSVQWVNSETGVVQPIQAIASLCRTRGVAFHTDASQAFGKLPINLSKQSVDFLTLTSHKIHGPQGVGALYARDATWLSPMLRGGSQEFDIRPGTENLPGIVGFGKAAELRSKQFDAVVAGLRDLRDQFEQRVLSEIPDVTINGSVTNRVCNTTNLCFHGVDGQALVARLDQLGIRCSQSSACTNHRPEPSYVLRAMGLSEEDAYSSVRFSFGLFNTEEEIEIAVPVLRDLTGQLRKFAAQLCNPYHAVRN